MCTSHTMQLHMLLKRNQTKIGITKYYAQPASLFSFADTSTLMCVLLIQGVLQFHAFWDFRKFTQLSYIAQVFDLQKSSISYCTEVSWGFFHKFNRNSNQHIWKDSRYFYVLCTSCICQPWNEEIFFNGIRMNKRTTPSMIWK